MAIFLENPRDPGKRCSTAPLLQKDQYPLRMTSPILHLKQGRVADLSQDTEASCLPTLPCTAASRRINN